MREFSTPMAHNHIGPSGHARVHGIVTEEQTESGIVRIMGLILPGGNCLHANTREDYYNRIVHIAPSSLLDGYWYVL